jgi:hypothetical protein
MSDNQLKIIRAMQCFFAVMAALVVGAFTWDMLAGRDSNLLGRLAEGMDSVGDPFGLFVVLVFWVVFAALLLEFIRREISGMARRTRMGRVLLAIRRPLLVMAIVQPLAALALVALMNVMVFRPDLLSVELEGFGLDAYLAFWLFYGIGHFMLVVLVLRAVRNRPFFVLTERGFLYEPGDLSPGLVRWGDITSLKEADLLSGNTSYAASMLRRTLVVSLKNPDKYSLQYNPLLRLMQGWAMKVVQHQVEGSADMVVRQDDLDARYEEVKTLMAQRVAKAGGSVSLL